jgi:hypothetical protein
MALLVELLLLVLLLVEECIPEALPVEELVFAELASKDEFEESEPFADREPFALFEDVESVDREALAFFDDDLFAEREAFSLLVDDLSAETEDDLLAAASSDWLWLLLEFFERLSVCVWLTFRLWSWVFEVFREESKLLLCDALLVTSEEAETLS